MVGAGTAVRSRHADAWLVNSRVYSSNLPQPVRGYGKVTCWYLQLTE